jgi:hypothetical protein
MDHIGKTVLSWVRSVPGLRRSRRRYAVAGVWQAPYSETQTREGKTVIGMTVNLDGDNAWPELREKMGTDQIIDLMDSGQTLKVAVLESGMASGAPSVALRFDLPDGRSVIAQTSAKLFVGAARMILARYPSLMD